MGQQFVHLHVHSHYSLLDGLTRIPELVAAAKADGQPAVALTDHGVLYGAIEFYKAAVKAGVKPIIGIEVYVAPKAMSDRDPKERYHHLILLAKNRTGYQHLLELTTRAHLDGFYYRPRIDWALLERFHDGLIALSGCLSGEVPRRILEGDEDAARAAIGRFQRLFGEDFFLELHARRDDEEAKRVFARIRELGAELGVPLVATNDVHYLTPDDTEAHDVLLCLQTKAKQTDTGRLSMLGEQYGFRSAKEMTLLFEDCPEAIANTLAIADRCSLELELGKIHLPGLPIPKGTTYDTVLRSACEEGFAKRYGDASSERQREARERMAYELGVIRDMGYAPYFLIVADFVNWAKRQGIVVGPGRGSAAGSIIAYLCTITNLDPLAYDLLFERFLAPGRVQMPDIDLDFADHRRDEVLAYVREKYGEDHVAQIITFGTMAARATVRDVGRVLDVPYTFCDRLAKLIPTNATLADALRDVPELRALAEADATTQRIFAIGKRLEGAARHTSTHACGVVISAEPLVSYLPIQHASAEDATIVTQYEMHAVEDLGLLKMDFLGLSNLSIIEHAVNTIRARGAAVDVDRLSLDDAATYALLQRGESTGIFQMESGGMKRYLKELKPTEFEDIIAMVSLYRPGPMELIPEYIDRKFGRKPVTYLHPRLEPILKRTYGIMVYQEQLMQLARDLAGFTMSEADTLRKAVGKKIKKLLDEQRQKLIDGMIANGIHQKIAKNIWEWIEPFARYGFNRSHGACYALIAYQTAYLKAHFPAEFMAALLTAERGNTDRLAILITECREMGISVLGPDVNESETLFTVVEVDGKPAVRFGLAAIKNVGEHLVEVLVAERSAHGPYRDIADLCARVRDKDFNKKALECLIRSGVFDSFGERGMLLANVDAILAYHRSVQRDAESGQENLFGTPGSRTVLRLASAEPAAQRLMLAWEKELLGLYLSAHPFAATAAAVGDAVMTIANVKQQHGDREAACGGIITRIKRITTKAGEPMLFVELEDHTGCVEVVVFPRVFAATASAWLPETIVIVRGKISDRDGTPKVLADRVAQVSPGRERDALRALGVGEGAGGAPLRERPDPVVITLPPSCPPERLASLRALLVGEPGATPVHLRSVNGRIVSTGLSCAWTDELREAVADLLGRAVVGEVQERVVA